MHMNLHFLWHTPTLFDSMVAGAQPGQIACEMDWALKAVSQLEQEGMKFLGSVTRMPLTDEISEREAPSAVVDEIQTTSGAHTGLGFGAEHDQACHVGRDPIWSMTSDWNVSVLRLGIFK